MNRVDSWIFLNDQILKPRVIPEVTNRSYKVPNKDINAEAGKIKERITYSKAFRVISTVEMYQNY